MEFVFNPLNVQSVMSFTRPWIGILAKKTKHRFSFQKQYWTELQQTYFIYVEPDHQNGGAIDYKRSEIIFTESE